MVQRTELASLDHFFLLRELVKRDFEGRYAGSALGFLWSLVQPLWQLVLFTFVFSVVLRFSLIGERTDNFAVYLFGGLLPWMAVSEGVSRSTTAVTASAELVKKLNFPAEILVVSAVLGALIQSAIAAGLFAIVLAVVGQLSILSLPLLVLVLVPQLALTLGIGLSLATVHVFVRDTAQVLGMLMMGWFYLTPIVYPLSMVPEQLQRWMALNPLTPLVGFYRMAFLGGGTEWLAGTGALLVSASVSLTFGLWLFRRAKSAFPDEV